MRKWLYPVRPRSYFYDQCIIFSQDALSTFPTGSLSLSSCYWTKTWVRSPTHSKANLLTPGCGEGKCTAYCKAPYKESRTANAQKAKLPDGFQPSHCKGKVREGSRRVCDQLVHNSLIGWWWGNKAVSQGLNMINPRRHEAACSWSSSS